MFRFETQSFYDFLNHVITVFFCFCSFAGGKGAGGGGHNRKLDSTLQCAQWKITDAHIDAHIYCIYLFNSISYGIHREGKEIQKNEWFHEKTGRNPWLKTRKKF